MIPANPPIVKDICILEMSVPKHAQKSWRFIQAILYCHFSSGNKVYMTTSLMYPKASFWKNEMSFFYDYRSSFLNH